MVDVICTIAAIALLTTFLITLARIHSKDREKR